MSAQHTPLPWTTGKGIAFSTSIYSGSTMVAFAREDHGWIPSPTADANAALIVRACNSHHHLIEAAEALLDRLYRSHLPSDGALPHASLEWQDARKKADALRDAIAEATPTPNPSTTTQRRSE